MRNRPFSESLCTFDLPFSADILTCKISIDFVASEYTILGSCLSAYYDCFDVDFHVLAERQRETHGRRQGSWPGAVGLSGRSSALIVPQAFPAHVLPLQSLDAI